MEGRNEGLPFRTNASGPTRWRTVMLLWLASMGTMIPCARGQENWLQADFRRESERVSDACKGA